MQILGPELADSNVFVEARLIPTSPKGRGGALSGQRVLRFLSNALRQRGGYPRHDLLRSLRASVGLSWDSPVRHRIPWTVHRPSRRRCMRRSCAPRDAAPTGSWRTYSRMSSRHCCSRIRRRLPVSDPSGRGGLRSLQRPGAAPRARNTSTMARTRIRRRCWSGLPATTRCVMVQPLPRASDWTVSATSAATSGRGSLGSSLFPLWCS